MANKNDINEIFMDYVRSDEVKQIMDKLEQVDLSEIYRQDPFVKKSIDMTIEELEDTPDEIKTDPIMYLEGYDALFDQYYSWIRATNPRWSVGGKRLMEWREAVNRYEACYDNRFHLVERIKPKKAQFALRVIPKDYLAFAGDKDHIILCAFRPYPKDASDEKESYTKDELINFPVGGLSARIIEQELGNVVVIEWLMVDPKYRGKGIAHSLMAELFCQLMDTPIMGITAFCDMFSDAVPGLLQLFAAWSFEFSLAPYPYHEIKLKQVKDYPKAFMLDGDETNIKPLSEIGRRELAEVINDMVSQEEPGVYDPYLPFLPKDYWDENISCAYVLGGKIEGLLLVHIDAFGRISIEAAKGDVDTLLPLLDYAAYTALSEHAGNTTVRYRVATETSEYIQTNVFKKGTEITYANASLVQPLDDVTPEEFDYLTEHPDAIDFGEMRKKEEKWEAYGNELLADMPDTPELKDFK